MARGKKIVITRAKSPCMNCENRAEGCHGKCEAYAAFRVKCDEIIAQNREKTEYDNYLSDVIRRMPGTRNI